MSAHELRDYQKNAINALRQTIRSGKRKPVLQMPTGAGKTATAGAIINMAQEKGNKVIFCVPAISLVNQTVESFERDGIFEIGVMQAYHERTDHKAPIQVASIQTLMRRDIPEASLVIVDECHVSFKFMDKWFKQLDEKKVPVIGLTATPWARGMGKLYDDLIIGTTTQELIDNGYLSGFKVFAPAHPDLTGVKIVKGDYETNGLSRAMQQGTLVADIVSTWLEKGQDRPTLCFAVDRAHAKKLQQQFQEANVPTAYMDAFTPIEEREEIAAQFASGEIKVVCNVGVLTTGIDWDVRCIILARPTRSEILYTQIIGRGLRTAEGKDHCIARGSKILTDKGEVNIEDVTLDHKLWDGVNWVSHSGAVCRGVQPVIEYCGITATSDHKVMTNEGWKTIEEASCRQLGIAVTGFGERPIRFSPDLFTSYIRFCRSPACKGHVQEVRAETYGSFSQHQEKTKYSSMPSLQWQETYNRAKLAVSKMSVATRQMSKSAFNFIQQVWRTRNKIQFQIAQRGGAMDLGEFGLRRSFNAVGSDKQQWALRAGQFALDGFNCEYEQHLQKQRSEGSLYSVQENVSSNTICGSDSKAFDCDEVNGRRDYSKMDNALTQTQREVWDILNAGPLQRFTANGRLVHNCLILDHSDTTLRLGFVTDIHHDTLDDGEKKRGEIERRYKLPKACPKCAYIKAPGVKECPACGFAPAVTSKVETEDGELLELTSKKTQLSKAWTRQAKENFYAELLGYARQKGYKDGWAYHAYKQRIGVGPPSRPIPLAPSPATLSWIRHLNIARAKQRERQNGLQHRSYASTRSVA